MEDRGSQVVSYAPVQDLSARSTSIDEKCGSTSEGEASTASEESGSDRYKCPGCDVTVTSKHELTVHIRSHNSEANGPGIRCTICGKSLGSQASLDRHVLVHSGERPFKCRLCGLAFTTNGNMNRHLRSHAHDSDSDGDRKRKLEPNNNVADTQKRPRGDPFACPACDRDFISLHVLENHLEETHPEFSAECAECRLQFKSFRVLNLHRFMVHYKPERGPDLSLVEFSTEKFPLIAQAMMRPRSVESSDDNQKDFFATLNLKKSPIKKEDSDMQSPPPANTALEITPPDSNYKEQDEEQDAFAAEFRRMKMKGEFPCRLCSAVFPNLRALKGHNRVHLSGAAGNFQCNMCPFFDADKSAVIRHMRTHNGDRPYECALCNYAFTTKANCERHLRNRHTASKELTKISIIYHQSEDVSDPKCEVKRSLFPDASGSEESASEREEEEEEEAPLDLSMDALDLSKKKTVDQPEDLSKRHYEINVPKVEMYYPNHFLSGFTPPFSPYYVPSPVYYQNRELNEMKERIQKELIRGLQLTGGTVVLERAATPEKPKKPVESTVKMVIKNGVLVPKQKQRRYRTERPFGCEHCSAKFTLRSNMERHVKQQHPQHWAQRQRGAGPRRPRPEAGVEVKAALAEAIRAKARPDEELASVSKLLDNASTQTFKQYFSAEEEAHSDEEGLVASHSEENSGSDEAKSEEGNVPQKKQSAYSLAPNRVSCPYCFRKFPWSSSLRRHVLTHTGQKPFKCSHCPLLFTTKSNCDRHLLRKHGGVATALPVPGDEPPLPPIQVDTKPFRCDQCPGMIFANQDALKRHIQLKHENPEHQQEEEAAGGAGEQPFKCHICSDEAFAERQEALDHLQEAHPVDYAALVAKGALDSSEEDPSDEPARDESRKFPDYSNRKVVCALCVRRFWSAEDLRRHMRTHTGERPFSCDVCSRRFTLKHSMLRHRKKHDTGIGSPPSLVPLHPAAEDNTGSDLISNLLGLRDRSIVDKMIEEKSADDAALLLGLSKQAATF